MSGACWLFVDAATTFGGHEVMLLRWLEELQQQARITPLLLARDGTRLQSAAPRGITVEPLSRATTGITHRALTAARDACRTVALIVKLRPQLCVVAEGSLLAQAGFTVLLRLLRQRTVVYVPLVEPASNMGFGRGALRDWLVRNVYRHLPQAWITITAEQATQLATWARIAVPIFTLPNTVARDIEQAPAADARAARPLRVLVLGRFDAHQKGLDGLLDALSISSGLHRELHITLVGDGPYAGEIERRLQQSPVLRGILSVRSWMPALDILREHDVLLLTSRYEGVPLVMLEAMALGIPVISSDLPGTRAMLPAECLFGVGDYQHALQLLRLSADPAWRTAIARRNRAVFAERASGASFVHAVRHLTNQLLRLAVWRVS